MSDILTREEREKFTNWLTQGVNPAIELLEVLDQSKLDSLADITSFLEAVAEFHAGVIARMEERLGRDEAFDPSLALCFGFFCLEAAQANQFHHKKLLKLNEALATVNSVACVRPEARVSHGDSVSHFASVTYLDSIFLLLNDDKKLVEMTEKQKQSVINLQIDKNLCSVWWVLKELRGSFLSLKRLAQNEELACQLDHLLGLIQQMISDNPALLTPENNALLMNMSGIFKDLASLDVSENYKFIQLHELTKIKSMTESLLAPQISQFVLNILEKIKESIVVDVNFVQYAKSYLITLSQTLTDKQLGAQINESLPHLLGLLEQSFACLYAIGATRSHIEEQVLSSIKEVAAEADNLLQNVPPKDQLLTLSNLIKAKTNVCTAEIIVHPIKMTIGNPAYVFSPELRQGLETLSDSIGEDVQSFVAEDLPVLLERRNLVKEINMFATVIGSEQLTLKEKEDQILKLERYLIKNLSILPRKIINALEQVLGVLPMLVLVHRLESTFSFFKKAATDYKKFAQISKQALEDIKKIPHNTP